MDIPNNNINQAVMNAINNPFLINSLTEYSRISSSDFLTQINQATTP